MYISFNGEPQEQDTRTSLIEQAGLSGRLKPINSRIGRIWYEDNEPERIEVWVAQKRREAILEAETQPGGRLSGLNLGLYQV